MEVHWRTVLLLVACVITLVNAGADGGKPEENDLNNDGKQGLNEGDKAPPPHHSKWGYNVEDGKYGPAHWSTLYATQCGEERKRQSPIDIITSNIQYSEDLGPINIEPEETDGQRMYLFNNGHAAQVNVEGDIYVVGGGLGELYKVAQLHFHWGADSEQGSEHQINGKKYPLEMHIVTYDSDRYTSLGEAVKGYNSIAVLGTLFEISERDNTAFDPITTHLKDVIHPKHHNGGRSNLEWLDLNTLLPADKGSFYRYEGSLTTPTCDESVIWSVFANSQVISEAQMNEFRALHEDMIDDKAIQLVNNYREPQPLSGRMVYSSFVLPDQVSKVKDDPSAQDSTENVASGLSISYMFIGLATLGSTFMTYNSIYGNEEEDLGWDW